MAQIKTQDLQLEDLEEIWVKIDPFTVFTTFSRCGSSFPHPKLTVGVIVNKYGWLCISISPVINVVLTPHWHYEHECQ